MTKNAANIGLQRTSRRPRAAAEAGSLGRGMRARVVLTTAVALICMMVPRIQVAQDSGAPGDSEGDGVVVTFAKRGAALDPWQQRLAESGAHDPTTDSGNAYWFRLYNGSKSIISFGTASIYMTPFKDWVRISKGNLTSTLNEGMEISALVSRQYAGRAGRLYGGDASSISTLMPGRWVFFSVPRTAFADNADVYLEYQYASLEIPWWSDRSETCRVYVPHVPN